jgi:hypothetical protein
MVDTFSVLVHWTLPGPRKGYVSNYFLKKMTNA